MELYEWGWIKKIPRIAVINAKGANTLYQLFNGAFGEEKLRWNSGTPNFELIEKFYNKMNNDEESKTKD